MLNWPLSGMRIAVGIAVTVEAVASTSVMRSIAAGDYVRVAMVPGVPFPPDTVVLVFVAVMAASGVGLVVGRGHRWWATACLVCLVLLIGLDQQLYSNHAYLAGLMALVLTLTPRDNQQSRVALMGTLSAVYLFSALSKLNTDFLSGGVLAVATPLSMWGVPPPALAALATGVVFIELLLAAGLWWPPSRRIAVIAGLALHIGIVTLVGAHRIALATFALLMWSIYPLFYSRAPSLPHGVPLLPDTRRQPGR